LLISWNFLIPYKKPILYGKIAITLKKISIFRIKKTPALGRRIVIEAGFIQARNLSSSNFFIYF